MKKTRIYSIFLLFVCTFSPLFSNAEGLKPQVQLANIYRKNIDIQNYLVSEKLDGVMAYWDGESLISREGNVFNAPKWFVKGFPANILKASFGLLVANFLE